MILDKTKLVERLYSVKMLLYPLLPHVCWHNSATMGVAHWSFILAFNKHYWIYVKIHHCNKQCFLHLLIWTNLTLPEQAKAGTFLLVFAFSNFNFRLFYKHLISDCKFFSTSFSKKKWLQKRLFCVAIWSVLLINYILYLSMKLCKRQLLWLEHHKHHKYFYTKNLSRDCRNSHSTFRSSGSHRYKLVNLQQSGSSISSFL